MSGILTDPVFILVLSLILVLSSILWFRLGAFWALLLGALATSVWNHFFHVEGDMNVFWAVFDVVKALGKTIGNVGLVILFGAVIGKCMTDAGAADRIVDSLRRVFGPKRAPVALTGSAFILSIPVFYDATFYLLLPLAKSLYRLTRKNYIFYLLAVGLAATISHTMIPPTPGPIMVSEILNAPLSSTLGIGLLVGLFLCPVALGLAWALDKIVPNPKLTQQVEEELAETSSTPLNVLENRVSQDQFPSLSTSLAPILIPVFLIAACSILKSTGSVPQRFENLLIIGNVNVALGIAALTSCLIAWKAFKRNGGQVSRGAVAHVLKVLSISAGTIVLITGVGGAYGATLRASGIGERIHDFMGGALFSGSYALTIAFFVTAALKSAQGSSTTAMITSSSILSTMNVTSETLGCNIAYLAVVIGAGSAVASWMNDSGFCVFSRSSGVSETDCLKVWTFGTGALGCAGFLITLCLSRLFPMI